MMMRILHRGIALLVALAACAAWIGCRRAEGGWRGTVSERNGIRFVSNEGTGIDAERVREELRPLWTAGGEAPGQPRFQGVAWIDFDPAGNIFALDLLQQKITKLAPDGRLLGQFGTRGEAAGQLSKSQRLAWANDRLYVANEGNGRIEVFGPSGETYPPIELPEVRTPSEVYYANQQFYVTRRFVSNGSFVYAYDQRWKLGRTLRPADAQTDPLDYLRSHNTVCAAPDGLWIVYLLLNRIQKVGWDGRVLLETSRELDFEIPQRQGRDIPEILVSRACAVDPGGNLYVIYSNPQNWKRGNDVFKFGPDGRLRQKAFTLPIFRATMLRFDGQGNLFFSDGKTLTKSRIERVEAR